MSWPRLVLPVLVVPAAFLAQVGVVPVLNLPGGAPDLVVVAVVAFALAGGPLPGAVTGFCAGLLADLAPPVDHQAGRLALSYAVVGYAAGLVPAGRKRSAPASIAVVAAATVAATLLFAATGLLTGTALGGFGALTRVVTWAVVYDVLLAPFVVPTVAAITRRLGPGVAQ